jgi:hypothetical protein
VRRWTRRAWRPRTSTWSCLRWGSSDEPPLPGARCRRCLGRPASRLRGRIRPIARPAQPGCCRLLACRPASAAAGQSRR